MFVVAGYLFSALSALIIWKIGLLNCFNEQCSTISLGYLERDWLLWGALFYSVSAVLIVFFSKKRFSKYLISTGTLFHWFITIKYYLTENYLCSICLTFLAVGTILNIIYIMSLSQRSNIKFLKKITIPILTITLLILIINPANKQAIRPPTTVEAAEIKTFGPKIEVINTNGEIKYLDLVEKPALLFAEWCPSCSDALTIVAENYKENPPYLVAVLTDESKRTEIELKLKDAGLKDYEYYISTIKPPVKGIPRLVWWENNALVDAYGGKINKTIFTETENEKKFTKEEEISDNKQQPAINAKEEKKEDCKLCDEIEKRLNNM